MKAGIYLITNTSNGKVYVGSTVNFERRFARHRQQLRRGIHATPHLQAAWSAHGESAFEFKALLYCSAENLLMYEQRAADAYKATDREHGYNYLAVVGSRLGTKHTEATKAKIAAKMLRGPAHPNYGKRLPDSAYAKAAALKKQFGMSEDTRAKMSASHTGRLKSEEHKRNIGLANKGRTNSLESRALVSATKKAQFQVKLRERAETEAAIALTML